MARPSVVKNDLLMLPTLTFAQDTRPVRETKLAYLINRTGT